MQARRDLSFPRRVHKLSLMLALLIWACSGSNGGSTSQSTGGAREGAGQTGGVGVSDNERSPTSALLELYRAGCQRQLDCNATEDSVEVCLEQALLPCVTEHYGSAIFDGTLDPLIRRCTPTYATLPCEAFGSISVLATAFVGDCMELGYRARGMTPARLGQACGLASPCIEDGQYCTALDNLSCGVCAALPRAGEACTHIEKCADGAGCDNGQCVLRLAAGDSCPKAISHLCGEGTRCREGVCEPRQVPGGACTRHLECEAGLICYGGGCRPRGSVGTSCKAVGDCEPGLVCDNGACAKVKLSASCEPSALGQACSRTFECQPGLECDLNGYRCRKEDLSGPGVGEPCTQGGGRVCKAGLRCDGTTCIAPSQVGTPCASLVDCESLRCEQNFCTGRSDGEPCEANIDCKNLSCNDVGFGRICGNAPACR